MFPQETGVLLVDANDILDHECGTVVLHKRTRLPDEGRVSYRQHRMTGNLPDNVSDQDSRNPE